MMATYDPSKPDAKVAAMQARAAVCQVLCAGTPEMRAAGRVYLPQWPQESDRGWESRRDCSVLFPALERTIEVMVGKPFGVPIIAGDDVPARVEAALEDVDRQGQDLDSWAREVARVTLRDGISWAIVDYPRLVPGATRSDELAIQAEPYLIHIPLAAMRGWKTQRIGGKTVITELRYAVHDDDLGEDLIYLWTRGNVDVYRKSDNDWILDPEKSGPVSLTSQIPVVCFYGGKRTGFWTAKPPLEGVAYLNVQHWQSSSDQRNILHTARVPLLAADERQGASDAPVAIGPDGIITGFPNLRFVEITGGSIAAGEADLARLEDQMRRVAGEMLQAKAGNKTATENNKESMEGGSQLRAFVWTFQDALEECLRLMALWIGEKGGGSLTVNTDWDDGELEATLWTALNGARTAGLITEETYLWNLQKGKRLPPDTTIEDEKTLLDQEAPPMVAPPMNLAKKPKTATITRPDGSKSTVTME